MSTLMKHLTALLGIRQVMTGSRSARSNGMAERICKYIALQLRTSCSDNQQDWPTHLQAIETSIRRTKMSSTSFTPFELVYGHKLRSFVDSQILPKFETAANLQEFIKQNKHNIELLQKLAFENKIEASRTSAKKHDLHTTEFQFAVGDRVLLQAWKSKKGDMRKQSNRYTGPYFVESLLPNSTSRLRDANTGGEYLDRQYTTTV